MSLSGRVRLTGGSRIPEVFADPAGALAAATVAEGVGAASLVATLTGASE
jgi:hypothetical protein